MITAIALIDADVALIPEVCEEVAALPGVSEVYSVTGDTDLIAMVRVRRHEDLADVVANRIGKVPGVRGTRTYIAFQAYSQHDLDEAFALGADE
ncbi:AsnC family transcriptional regulator [Serinibacter arcticus]|uniref:AsnC family transcriptional regulator n=1 Tax=Serinibacter arcticus TaxID=1655435 RepID=A0A2U1ZSB5_9MICO|nr:Lrp/AsnC ligand binding domain-containing protein [Serinibacter arcticus]PWD49851.1 AsnC family transcriptional regulator [Serinibacter arcticus]